MYEKVVQVGSIVGATEVVCFLQLKVNAFENLVYHCHILISVMFVRFILVIIIYPFKFLFFSIYQKWYRYLKKQVFTFIW